jgi:hypothetical protein
MDCIVRSKDRQGISVFRVYPAVYQIRSEEYGICKRDQNTNKADRQMVEDPGPRKLHGKPKKTPGRNGQEYYLDSINKSVIGCFLDQHGDGCKDNPDPERDTGSKETFYLTVYLVGKPEQTHYIYKDADKDR